MRDFIRALLFLPPAASEAAEPIDTLHAVVIAVSLLGSLAVATLAVVLVVRYRKGDPADGAEPPTSHFSLGKRIELPLYLGIAAMFLAWWVVGVRQYGQMRRPPEDAMTVYVVGKQWMFKFSYPDGTRSSSRLVVPLGKPVRLVMTSRDVIHSLYVPAFRIKQDLVPGRTTTMWFEADQAGRYPILCAEYCGDGHSQMRAEVVVLPGPDYQAWLAEQSGAQGEPLLAERGLEVAAEQGCLRCHTTDGTPHLAPSFAGLFGSTRTMVDGTTRVADEAYLTESMTDPMAHRVAGYPALMPSYQGRLTPEETSALVQLILSLRSESSKESP